MRELGDDVTDGHTDTRTQPFIVMKTIFQFPTYVNPRKENFNLFEQTERAEYSNSIQATQFSAAESLISMGYRAPCRPYTCLTFVKE